MHWTRLPFADRNVYRASVAAVIALWALAAVICAIFADPPPEAPAVVEQPIQEIP